MRVKRSWKALVQSVRKILVHTYEENQCHADPLIQITFEISDGPEKGRIVTADFSAGSAEHWGWKMIEEAARVRESQFYKPFKD